jgi:hypothetical protein
MAHKSREPQRAMRGKITIPRDRGEKYVAPQILPGEDAGLAWSKDETSGGPISRQLHRQRLARRGDAHDLIRKLDVAILHVLAKR